MSMYSEYDRTGDCMNDRRSTPLEIVLVNNSLTEQQAATLLHGWFAQVPLEKYQYTDRIQIEDGAVPHSHPVLTLSPYTPWNDYLMDPEQFLAAYIHEQMHWFVLLVDKAENARHAMATFQERYPDLPVPLPKGCGSPFANYLHIVVNTLEYQGLTDVLGGAGARQVLARVPHYTAIYNLVLSEMEHVQAVLKRYDLVLDEQPPMFKRFVEIGSSS